MIFFGEESLRTAVQNFVANYHSERNRQDLAKRLISPKLGHLGKTREIKRRQRLGVILNYYFRAGAPSVQFWKQGRLRLSMNLMAGAEPCRCMHKPLGTSDFSGHYVEQRPLVHAHKAANTGLPSCVGSAQSGRGRGESDRSNTPTIPDIVMARMLVLMLSQYEECDPLGSRVVRSHRVLQLRPSSTGASGSARSGFLTVVVAVFRTAALSSRTFTGFLAGNFADDFFAGAFFATVRLKDCTAFNGAAFFAGAFVTVAILAMDGPAFAAALFAAQRAFVASEMAFLPAAESVRFDLEGSVAGFDGG